VLEEAMRKLASGGVVVAAVVFASLVRAQAPAPSAAPATREVDPGVFNTSPVIDRAELRAGSLEIKPGGTRRVHQHDDVQFHLFIPLTGAVQLNMGTETINATPGNVYFINKGTAHGFKNATGSTATAVEVFVKPR
jgi:quercetin dioxygenase-like cupin family protein